MRFPLSWKVRIAVEGALFLIMIACLIGESAPRWAIILAVYVGTRTSTLETANDMGAVQSSVRYTREDLRLEIQAARDEIRKVFPGEPHA